MKGLSYLIAEKWKSFTQHVANIHENFPSTDFKDFKKCAHNDQIEKRRNRYGIYCLVVVNFVQLTLI